MHAPRVRRTVGVLPDAFRAYEYVNMDPPRETKSGAHICTPTTLGIRRLPPRRAIYVTAAN